MVYVVIWIACGIGGYFIGASKGRGALGAILGGLLGVIGLIIIAVMGPAPDHVPAYAESSNGPGLGVPRASVEQRLAKLEQLRQSGVLAQGEYESQRRRVLAEM